MKILAQNVLVFGCIALVLGALARGLYISGTSNGELDIGFPRWMKIIAILIMKMMMIAFIVQLGNVFWGWTAGKGSGIGTIIIFGG